MSKRFFKLAAVAIASATLAFSQAPPSGPKGGFGPRSTQPTRGGPGVSDFLATYLGLTDAQKEQANAIFAAEQEAITALRDQSRAANDALQSAAKANKSDAEMDQLAAAVGNLFAQTAAIHAKASAKFYALLTPDQRDKLDKLPHPGGPGGPMGMGIPRM